MEIVKSDGNRDNRLMIVLLYTLRDGPAQVLLDICHSSTSQCLFDRSSHSYARHVVGILEVLKSPL